MCNIHRRLFQYGVPEPRCMLVTVQPTLCNFYSDIMSISTFLILKKNEIFLPRDVLLRAKKVGHQISVSFEKFDVYAVHDYFKHAGGRDIFLLNWHQVLSYDV
jgi:hypothetical protein